MHIKGKKELILKLNLAWQNLAYKISQIIQHYQNQQDKLNIKMSHYLTLKCATSSKTITNSSTNCTNTNIKICTLTICN